MKKHILLFVILFPFSVLAKDIHPEMRKGQVVDEGQKNHFLTQTETLFPSKVNPITGEYSEEETDLVVAGSQPLSFRRFYNTYAPQDIRTASWRYNPEATAYGNLEWKEQDIFVAVGERDGGVNCLKPNTANTFRFEILKNFSQSKPDGKTHPLNIRVSFQKILDPKVKSQTRYQYEPISLF